MPNNNYYQGIASDLSNQGRYGDSMLMHVNPAEVQGLASAFPGQVTINPETGLPEAFAIIPALLIGAAIGGITNLATGSQTPLWQSILMGAAGSALTGGLGSVLGGGTAAVAPVATEAVTQVALGSAAELTAAQLAEQAALKAAEDAAISSALSSAPTPPVLDTSLSAYTPPAVGPISSPSLALPPPPPFSPIGQNLGAGGLGDGLGAGGLGDGLGAGGIGDGLGSPDIFTGPREYAAFPSQGVYADPPLGPVLGPELPELTIGDRIRGGLGDLNTYGQDIFGENYGFTKPNIKDYFTSVQPLGAFGFPLLFEEDDYGFDDVPATEHDEFWTV